MAASRSRARNRLPSCDQPRFKDRSWAEDVRPELPAGQVRDQVPPVNRRGTWIDGKRKAALIGDIAPILWSGFCASTTSILSACRLVVDSFSGATSLK
jgi:hypothetical protein